MRDPKSEIRLGMGVRGSEGEPIGRVTRKLERSFRVEFGQAAPVGTTEYDVGYEAVLAVRDSTVLLTVGRDSVVEAVRQAASGAVVRVPSLPANEQSGIRPTGAAMGNSSFSGRDTPRR